MPTAEPSDAFAGDPDGMDRLWTPHRLVYLNKDAPEAGCAFCNAPQRSDEDGLIVYRGVSAYVIMNLYPYNSGHIMVCPFRHVATYDLATHDEVAEIGALTQTAMTVLSSVTGCDGFNIGMNQGEVAGAGIADHLHQHIVPRWKNDANFFPIIAQTKAFPRLLGDMRTSLSEAWPRTS
ncbi:MAG: HIT family protein [Microbacteriaceae bacterium]